MSYDPVNADLDRYLRQQETDELQSAHENRLVEERVEDWVNDPKWINMTLVDEYLESVRVPAAIVPRAWRTEGDAAQATIDFCAAVALLLQADESKAQTVRAALRAALRERATKRAQEILPTLLRRWDEDSNDYGAAE